VTKLLLVGAGGALGALLRYLVAGLVAGRSPAQFPWSTLVVNAVGCLVIGCLMAVAEARSWFGAELRLLLFTGVLGSFTTFSTFGFDTFHLLRQGESGAALLYVAASLGLGILLVVVGFLVTRSAL